MKYLNERQLNRNNSQGSDYDMKGKTKDSLKGHNNPRESPKSYTTKIKSLVDNLGSGYNVSHTKTGGKHVFLEYINKDTIQPHSGVFFNVKYDNFANTPTETRFGTQFKDIYNITTDDGFRNDGSNSNRIYDYNHHNDMKYNGPKRDDFSNKLRKDDNIKDSNQVEELKITKEPIIKETSSDVHFKFNNNNYINTDDRDKNIPVSGNQKSTYIKSKLEKYYTKAVKDTTLHKDNSPQKLKDYPSYSLTYKAKNMEKTMSKGTFNSTMQKFKK
jgi:hypothetical protein